MQFSPGSPDAHLDTKFLLFSIKIPETLLRKSYPYGIVT